MRIAVVSSRYPSMTQPYNHMFVHARSRTYLSLGHEVLVGVPSREQRKYEFEGVNVVLAPAQEIAALLEGFDVVMVHLLYHDVESRLNGGLIYERLIREKIPVLFFIHGIEVQRIARSRRDDIDWRIPKSIARWLYQDLWRIPRMRATLQAMLELSGVVFVVPSRWMLGEAERSIGVKISHKTRIIPNGIDVNFFSYRLQSGPLRSRALAIRPLFARGKYGVDLALAAFGQDLNGVELTLVGDGPDGDHIAEVVAGNHNITLQRGFCTREGLRELHWQHGIYFAPTRMDAQGVSMCEAMASGLPVVSFDVCAIPEFVHNRSTGLVVGSDDVVGARDAILELVEDSALYERVSQGGRAFTESIATDVTAAKELSLAAAVAYG